MGKVENQGSKVQATAAPGAGSAAKEAPPPPEKLAIGDDKFKGAAQQPPSEAERQTSVVVAAKAAQVAALGVVGAAVQAGLEEAKGGQAAGAAGKAAGGAAKGAGPAQPRSFWQALGDRARRGGENIWRGLANIYQGDHPVAAIGRGALRMVPIAGIIPLASDTLDARKTLGDPKASLGQKALAGIKAVAGLGAVGAASLLLVTGAGAFLPWALGAGAVALAADVAVSRIRTGHW